MSSDDNDAKEIGQGPKKRRIQRACDACRRKKVRCDGIQKAGSQCTNCTDYGIECTYVEAAKRRGPPKSYVDKLENRVERLHALLTTISPEALRLVDSPPPQIPSYSSAPSTSSLPPLTQLPSTSQRSSSTSFIRHLGSKETTPAASENDETESSLIDQIDKLRIHPNGRRFFGKSSVSTLLKVAMELRQSYLGEDSSQEVLEPDRDEEDHGQYLEPHSHFWSPRSLSSEDTFGLALQRSRTSEQPSNARPKYIFPPPDLIRSLTDLYFAHMNLYLPLLHRPTFERAITQGLHHTDPSFGSTLLLVCAVAARYSDDPRVKDDDEADEAQLMSDGSGKQNNPPRSTHSYGWKWFRQVPAVQFSHIRPPSLYDLQYYALTSQFLQASSVPQACWTIAGIGIRAAQDVGAHRKKIQGIHTVEDELWKRAFWVLVCMDRLFASSTGRPCSIQDEDFDVDLPIECDDEYWEHPDPELRWRQPNPEKMPSLVTYFNVYIRLNQILAFLLRTVYAINKSKILLGLMEQSWEESVVTELDSALNTWRDNLPDHLRWDPRRTNKTFFNQSASLYSAYYHIQILVHRPFIPSPRKPDGALSFQSLAICTNAARACSHIVDTHRKRSRIAIPPVQTAAFSSGVILLLSIWGGKRSGLSTDFDREMGNVRKCMDVLKASESRWFHAGRLYDILCELASVGDLPVPRPSSDSPNATNQKREREPEPDDEEDEAKGKDVTPTPAFPDHRRPLAHSLYETPDANVVDHTPRAIAGRARRHGPVSVLPHGGVSDGGMNPAGSGYHIPVHQQKHQYQPELYNVPGYDLESTSSLYHLSRQPVSHNETRDSLQFPPEQLSIPPPPQPPPQPQPPIPPSMTQLQYLQQSAYPHTAPPNNQSLQYWSNEPIASTSRNQNVSHGRRTHTETRIRHLKPRPVPPGHIQPQSRMVPLTAPPMSSEYTPSSASSSSSFGPSSVYYTHQSHDLDLGNVSSSFGLPMQSGDDVTPSQAYGQSSHAQPSSSSSSSYGYGMMHGDHDHGLGASMDINTSEMSGPTAGGTSTEAINTNNDAHDGAFAMFAAAPMNFEVVDWGNYLSNINHRNTS